MNKNILEVGGLKTYFYTEAGIVRALEGVSFFVQKGETMGLVGETGSGKTVTALSIMRIVPRPGRIVSGSIKFDGTELTGLSEEEMRMMRGRKMAMIFQDPNSSLNPLYTVENQLSEIIRTHMKDISKQKARDMIIELLNKVGIAEPEERIKWYPHQFSGGQRQRIAIARAILLRPELLFADEPTTNLDVTIQAQVLELMKNLKKEFDMTMVLITHDMGVVAEMTDRVTVLYAGQVAEIGNTIDIFKKPLHPYTRALLDAVPRVDVRKKLIPIPGTVPNLINPPSGCRFHPRCKFAIDKCKVEEPKLEEAEPGHWVACHRWREI